MDTTPESRPPGVGFDAARWLSDWADHGGIVLLANNRLHLRRLAGLDWPASRSLDAMRDAMLHAGAAADIANHLLRQREGEVT